MLREFLRHISLELNRSPHTVKAYEADLNGLNEFLIKSGVPVDDTGFFIAPSITTADIREWIATLSEAGISSTSVRRKIQAVRAYFKFLVKSGVMKGNPASSITLPRPHKSLPAVASHSDIENSIEEASSLREDLILEMLYGCGLRRSELIGINDNDINRFSRELKILGKGNRHRIIPLPELLLKKITDWQEERDRLYPDLPSPKPLIAGKRGRMSVSSLYLIVRRALQNSGAWKKSPHTLRHSFATQLLNSGADINSVKNLLGHSSLGATQIYTHLAFSELKREWNKAHPRSHRKKE